MYRVIALLIVTCLLVSCKEEDKDNRLPVGFELVSRHGPSYFVYVHPEHWGKRIEQKDVGRAICTGVFDSKKYCEVYYFAAKRDIPQKFPITNRIKPIGQFEMKDGVQSFRALAIEDVAPQKEGKVVFYKNFYRHFFGQGWQSKKREIEKGKAEENKK